MIDAIYFDMDGTIADLYGVDNWLEKLRAFNPEPYYDAKPLVDMRKLNNILEQFTRFGVTIGVISWLAKDSRYYYDKRVRDAKRAWLDKYLPIAQEIHIVKYGRTKLACASHKNSILIDDNEKVRQGWHGAGTIDANQDIFKELEKYLDKFERML